MCDNSFRRQTCGCLLRSMPPDVYTCGGVSRSIITAIKILPWEPGFAASENYSSIRKKSNATGNSS